MTAAIAHALVAALTAAVLDRRARLALAVLLALAAALLITQGETEAAFRCASRYC